MENLLGMFKRIKTRGPFIGETFCSSFAVLSSAVITNDHTGLGLLLGSLFCSTDLYSVFTPVPHCFDDHSYF